MADNEGLTRREGGWLRRVGATMATATDPAASWSESLRAQAAIVGGSTALLAGGGGIAALVIHDPAPFAAAAGVLSSPYVAGAGIAASATALVTWIGPMMRDNDGDPASNNPARAAHLRRISAGAGLVAAIAAAGTGLAAVAGHTGVLPHDGTLVEMAGGIASLAGGGALGVRGAAHMWNRARDVSFGDGARSRGFLPAAEMPRARAQARGSRGLTE